MSETKSDVRYADSMEAAAAMLGRSLVLLQRLKAMGCPAFRGSRVYLDEVELYIAENDVEPIEREIEANDALSLDLKRRKLMIQDELHRKLRFANDVEEGKYIAVQGIADLVGAIAMEIKGTLRRKLEEEGPDRLAMRDRTEVTKAMRQIVDEICEQFQRSKLCRDVNATPKNLAQGHEPGD